MPERFEVKITVLRRFHPTEIFTKSPVTPLVPLGECEKLKDGQEFVVGTDGDMPQGFCASAWQSIYHNVRTFAFGGDFSAYFQEKNVFIGCCTDGLRPVIFRIERI